MSKERPKRNIIQKKYVSKPTFSLFFMPHLLTNAIALFKFASMKMHKLSSRAVKVTISLSVHYLGQISFLKGNGCKLPQRVNNYMLCI